MSSDAAETDKEPAATIAVRYFDVTRDYQAQLSNCLHRINPRSKFAVCDECGGQARYIFYDHVTYAIKCRYHVKQRIG